MSPRPSRPRTAAAALALLTAGLAAAQEPIPIPLPMPATPSAELQRLAAAARAQAKTTPAAAEGPVRAMSAAEQRRLALAATLQPAMPGQPAAALPAASRAVVFDAVQDRLTTQFRLRPGTPAYSNAFQDQLLQMRALRAGPSVTGARVFPGAPQPTDPRSVTTTAVYQRNFPDWVQRVRIPAAPGRLRVVGGGPTADTEFLDCVALIGNCPNYGCSGTLVGKNVVVTAAHCITGGCPQQVFVGSDSRSPSRGKVFDVKYRVRHPEYDPTTDRNDIAVLILDADADVMLPGLTTAGGPARVAPRAIATTAEINEAKTVELVGFGRSQFADFGVKSQVLVTISSYECSGRGEADTFGCNPGVDLVAGGKDLDSCRGDSGGPVYIPFGTGYKLAAVTSRKTLNATRDCGDGAVNTRADVYHAWIARAAADYGGRFR